MTRVITRLFTERPHGDDGVAGFAKAGSLRMEREELGVEEGRSEGEEKRHGRLEMEQRIETETLRENREDERDSYGKANRQVADYRGPRPFYTTA